MAKKALVGAILATALSVGLATSASAHVGIDGDAPKGGFGRFTFSVPNESDTAKTVKFEVQLPKDQPLAFASAEAKAGWTVDITTRKLAKPITDDGKTLTEAPDTITWSGGEIGPGEFATFSVSGGPFPDADELVMKAIQTYSDGEEVAWIDPTPPSGEEPEHPAPVLKLAAAESDQASAAASSPRRATTAPSSSDDDKSGLAVAALVISIVALLASGAGFFVGRRSRAT